MFILKDSETRGGCLSVLAASIVEANVYGRHVWAFKCFRDAARLIVGHFVVCTLEDDRVWLALDAELLETSGRAKPLEQSGVWQWSFEDEKYYRYVDIPSRNGYYKPMPGKTKIWPEIRRLHFEFIYKAAHGRAMDLRTPEGHTDGILKYLRNMLGLYIPDPMY